MSKKIFSNVLSLLFVALALTPIISNAEEKSAPRKTAPKKIVVIGDSISAGYGINKDLAYPQLLENKLNSAGKNVEVINGAESGAISAASLERLKFYIKRVKPDIVLLAIGGNDARARKPIETIKSNIEKTILFAKQNELKIILAGQKIFSNLGPEYTGKFEKIYFDLAKKHDIPLIPFLLKDVGGVKSMNIADGFHPNEAGHEKIAETVLPYFLEVL